MSFLKKLFGKKSDPQDWREVVKNLAATISKTLNTPTEIEWGPEPAQTRIDSKSPGGATMYTFTGNIVNRCLAQPEDTEEIFREHIESLAENMQRVDSEPVLAVENVLPLIKPMEWLQVALKQLQSAGAKPEELENKFVRRPLQDDLLIVYVIDTEHGMSYLSRPEAEQLGLGDAAALHQAALDNLRKKLAEASCEGGGGRYAIRLDGNYDASLALLMDELLPRIDINGNPVMAIPSRDELLVCGDLDTESVQSLQEVAGEIFAVNPYTITRRLYTWQNGNFVGLS